MKTKELTKTLLCAILMVAIIATILVFAINNESAQEKTSLSLFPTENVPRPSLSDFKMMGNRLVTYTGTATTIRAIDFPQGITTIGINAFSPSSIEYVELPETVTKLENNSFYGCNTLKNISIPASCTSVGYAAFHGCNNLEKVVIKFDNPDVFAHGVFSSGNHDFDLFVPKDSFNDFYNSSKFTNVKTNLKLWNVNLTISDFNNGQSYNGNISFGQTVTLPVPNKDGYAFTGWKDALNNDMDNTFRWMFLEDCSITATWEIEQYEVVYNGRDGQQYYLTANGFSSTPVKITYGELLGNSLIQNLYEQFRNPGEYLESVTINNINVSNGTCIWDLGENNGRYIIDLKFSQKHYNLRFDSTLSNVSVGNIDNLEYGDQVVLPTIPQGSKKGYLFAHWYVTNENYSGDRIINFNTMQDCDYNNNSAYINLWLRATFSPKTYTVNLNANGGACTQETVTATYDQLLPYISTPSREGYRFMGWQYENNRVDNRLWMIDENNVTIYAIWEKLYTITLDTKGGQVSGSQSFEVIYGENIGNKLKQPTRDKHRFLYWSYNGLQINNSTTWNERNNGTVVANWEELYRITFDAKGGTVSPAYIDLAYGDKIPTLPIATKPGYTFSGWYYNSIDFDASGYITERKDITLTTKWWNQVILTNEASYTVTEDCTFVYLKGVASNLIKPMNVYIASNVDNVKFTSNNTVVSCKSIIVNSRTKPLTIEFDLYRSIGNQGEAALNASACDNLNIIARGTSALNGGESRKNSGHGGLICKNVNFYGNEIIFGGGVAGAVSIVDGKIMEYYNPGSGIYASGNISIYCTKLEVNGGQYTIPMARPSSDNNKSNKISGTGIELSGTYDIYIDIQSTLDVEGGKGMSNYTIYDSYVGDGGVGIKSKEQSTISGQGSLIVKGGDGGDNHQWGYNQNKGGNGGSPTNKINISTTVQVAQTQGAEGADPSAPSENQ